MELLIFFTFLITTLNFVSIFLSRDFRLLVVIAIILNWGYSILSFSFTLYFFLRDGNDYYKKIFFEAIRFVSKDLLSQWLGGLQVRGESIYCNQAFLEETRHGPCSYYRFHVRDDNLGPDQAEDYSHLEVLEDLPDFELRVISTVFKGSNFPEDMILNKRGNLIKISDGHGNVDFRYLNDKSVDLGRMELSLKSSRLVHFSSKIDINEISVEVKTIFDSNLGVQNLFATVSNTHSRFEKNLGDVNMNHLIRYLRCLTWWSKNPKIGIKKSVGKRRNANIFHVYNVYEIYDQIKSGFVLRKSSCEHPININEGVLRNVDDDLKKIWDHQINDIIPEDGREGWRGFFSRIYDDYLKSGIEGVAMIMVLNKRDYLTTKLCIEKRDKNSLPKNWTFKRFCVDLNYILNKSGNLGVSNIDKKIPPKLSLRTRLEGSNLPERDYDNSSVLGKKIDWDFVVGVLEKKITPESEEVLGIYKEIEKKCPYADRLLKKADNNAPRLTFDEYGCPRSLNKTRSNIEALRNLIIKKCKENGKDYKGRSFTLKKDVTERMDKTFIDALMNNEIAVSAVATKMNNVASNLENKTKKLQASRIIPEKSKPVKLERLNSHAVEKTKINSRFLLSHYLKDEICNSKYNADHKGSAESDFGWSKCKNRAKCKNRRSAIKSLMEGDRKSVFTKNVFDVLNDGKLSSLQDFKSMYRSEKTIIEESKMKRNKVEVPFLPSCRHLDFIGEMKQPVVQFEEENEAESTNQCLNAIEEVIDKKEEIIDKSERVIDEKEEVIVKEEEVKPIKEEESKKEDLCLKLFNDRFKNLKCLIEFVKSKFITEGVLDLAERGLVDNYTVRDGVMYNQKSRPVKPGDHFVSGRTLVNKKAILGEVVNCVVSELEALASPESFEFCKREMGLDKGLVVMCHKTVKPHVFDLM